jgi:hypothetical protein
MIDKGALERTTKKWKNAFAVQVVQADGLCVFYVSLSDDFVLFVLAQRQNNKKLKDIKHSFAFIPDGISSIVKQPV